MKEVYFSDNHFDAELVIGRLKDSGIEAYMYNQRGIVADIEPRYLRWSGSVSVMVSEGDYKQAVAILAQDVEKI